MPQISPPARVTLGLVLLALSVLLLGQIMGFAPDQRDGLLDGRKKFCEALAIEFSSAVTQGDMTLVKETLDTLVKRNDDVLSAALVRSDGQTMVEAGDHARHWLPLPFDKSTATHIQVPIYQGNKRWGTVQLSFDDLVPGSLIEQFYRSYLGLMLFFLALASTLFFLFIKRTIKELNPRAVIPERVKAAFDSLAEGVLILDEKGQVVLANDAILKKLDLSLDGILGRMASQMGWRPLKNTPSENPLSETRLMPWEHVLKEGTPQTGMALRFTDHTGSTRTFMVNSAPISDPQGRLRGVLATFDDMTMLEKKHAKLQHTLKKLRRSEADLSKKNRQLEMLATRDPMTNCLNRRAFFEAFETLFKTAREQDTPLSCVMCDIDHFKSFNDRFGHAIGDKVIKAVATTLQTLSREEDVVGRYGGEEFCILLPGLTATDAFEVAERLRKAILSGEGFKTTSALRITASFGVSDLEQGAPDPGELLKQADKALYAAKENGRNRVILWDDNHLPDTAPTVANGTPDPSVEDEESTLVLQRRIAELETDLANRTNELQKASTHDKLTGLPNRLLLIDRIENIIRQGIRYHKQAALLSLELSMFRQVNNTFGHAVGERILQAVSDRLAHILRRSDSVSFLNSDNKDLTLSRIGNEEFAILVTDLSDSEDATWIIKRIFETLSRPIDVEGDDIYISADIGIAIFPHDGDTAEQLLHNAALARQQAKTLLGRNNFHFYSPEINERSTHQLRLQNLLHKALDNGEFFLHYQPKIDAVSDRISGFEALLRWDNPELGLVPPNDFIPLAEKSGFISEIGEWVLRTAALQARHWQEAGFGRLSIAVNLSAVQFRNDLLVTNINNILKEVGLPADQLELELTESTIMDNLDVAVDVMQQLHDIGIRLSIDDFGTGYSSLSYLKRFTIDQLKIDRSFLSELPGNHHDEAIVRAIVAMAHSMEMEIVAEGVETKEQADFLRNLGCNEFQGFYFSRPLPSTEVMLLLEKQQTPEGHLSLVAGKEL